MKTMTIVAMGILAITGMLSADANSDRRAADSQRSFNQEINRNTQKQADFQRQVQQNYQNRNVTPPYVAPRPVYNNNRR